MICFCLNVSRLFPFETPFVLIYTNIVSVVTVTSEYIYDHGRMEVIIVVLSVHFHSMVS